MPWPQWKLQRSASATLRMSELSRYANQAVGCYSGYPAVDAELLCSIITYQGCLPRCNNDRRPTYALTFHWLTSGTDESSLNPGGYGGMSQRFAFTSAGAIDNYSSGVGTLSGALNTQADPIQPIAPCASRLRPFAPVVDAQPTDLPCRPLGRAPALGTYASDCYRSVGLTTGLSARPCRV